MIDAGRAENKLAAMFSSAGMTAGLRLTYYALIMLIVVPLGSLDPRPLHLFSLGFFLLSAVVVVTRPVPPNTRRLFVAGVIVSCTLAAWIIIQTLDIPGNPFANPIWAQAEVFFGPMPRPISVAPADSMEAMIPVLLPFIVFLTGLLLFSSDNSAQRLLRYLCILASAIAVFGLVEFIFFPEQLLFAKKTAHLDGLTAVFLNKNTAATFLGVAVLLNIAMAFGHIQSAGMRDFINALSGGKARIRTVDIRWTIFYLIAGSLSFIALMMTKSRAGIGSSFLGMAVVLAILGYYGRSSSTTQHSFAKSSSSVWMRLGRASATLLVVVVLGAVFAGQALLRTRVQGADDLRFCVMPGELRLLGDNWLLGTGLGTFRDVFPPYLDPRCGINYVWNRAHNIYIEGWINLGLPFVILALIVVSILLVVLVRGVRTRRRLRFVPVLGLGALIIVLAHSALDYSLQIPGFAVFWAAVLTPCLVIASERSRSASKVRIARRPDMEQMTENRTDD